MPYIPKSRRKQIMEVFIDEMFPQLTTAGELNYFLSATLISYVMDNGLNYQTINDIIGAIEGAKAEFQRKVVAPYEDKKISENGDLAWPTS
jgi:hypothetical protein